MHKYFFFKPVKQRRIFFTPGNFNINLTILFIFLFIEILFQKTGNVYSQPYVIIKTFLSFLCGFQASRSNSFLRVSIEKATSPSFFKYLLTATMNRNFELNKVWPLNTAFITFLNITFFPSRVIFSYKENRYFLLKN